ncbi:MAG: HEAT repeat domain-containing protein [Opitutae bacterium]|nr:HEAT repeat domain-containing protein [Opitutae bacterium]
MPRAVTLLLFFGLLAAGRGADNGAFTPEKAARLRQARTVSVEIKQGWAWAAEEQAEKTDPTDTAAGDKKPRDLLPLAELTKAAVEFAGWKVVAPGEPADLRLEIETYGSALGADYVGTVTGHNYSGAELSGHVTLFQQDQDVLYEKFAGTIHPPTSINRFYSRPQDAPYDRLLPDCLEAIYKTVEAVFGRAPILAALKKGEYEHRTAAARVLFAFGETADTPEVAALLQTGDENLRTLAATALGVFGTADALPALLAALRDDPGYPAKPEELNEEQLTNLTKFDCEVEKNSDTRRDKARDIAPLERHEAVQWALLQNPAPDKVRRLAALLRDRSAPPVARRAAALVLGPLKDPVAGEALLAALRDESFIVRAAAISALNNANYHGQRRVADALLELTTDPQAFVRSRARSALGDLATEILAQHVRATYGPKASVHEHLTSAMEHTDPLVRLGAVRLGQYDGDKLAAALGRLLQGDPVPVVREAALEILVGQHRPGLETRLARALADPDRGVAGRALAALDAAPDNYGDEEQKPRPPLPESATKPLLALMDADAPPEAAWHVLERVRGDGVNNVLLAAAQRDGAKPGFREMMVIELARRGDRRATPLVAAQLNHAGELRYGYLLVEAASKLDDPALLDPLFGVLRLGTPAARLLTVRILGGMSHTRSVGPLIAALSPAEDSDRELAGGIREALHNLTGQDHGGSNGWLRWWKENSGKPIVRPAPKKPAEEAPVEKPAEETSQEENEKPKSG